MSRAANIATSERTLNMLRTAMGPTITQALDDPDVIEIMLNPDGRLWLDKVGLGRFDSECRLEPDEAERVVKRLSLMRYSPKCLRQVIAFLFWKIRASCNARQKIRWHCARMVNMSGFLI